MFRFNCQFSSWIQIFIHLRILVIYHAAFLLKKLLLDSCFISFTNTLEIKMLFIWHLLAEAIWVLNWKIITSFQITVHLFWLSRFGSNFLAGIFLFISQKFLSNVMIPLIYVEQCNSLLHRNFVVGVFFPSRSWNHISFKLTMLFGAILNFYLQLAFWCVIAYQLASSMLELVYFFILTGKSSFRSNLSFNLQVTFWRKIDFAWKLTR